MAEKTYMISMCPPEMRPVVGDPVIVSFGEDDDRGDPPILMSVHGGKKFSCLRVSTPPGEVSSGEFTLLEAEETSGSVSDIRVMHRSERDIAEMAAQVRQFVAEGRFPEEILVTVSEP